MGSPPDRCTSVSSHASSTQCPPHNASSSPVTSSLSSGSSVPSDSTPSSSATSSLATGTKSLKHIMVISGQEELAETIQLELSQVGYQISVMHDGLRGLLAANRMNPDIVVAGWYPPRISGIEICQRLRASRRKRPIVLLTPDDNVSQRISGFEAGADDCISLPLQKEEFVARIKARLHGSEEVQGANSLLYCADLLLNRETREVFRSGHFVRLTAKEFDLLEYLMDHYFQVVTRAQILENVWGYDYAGSSNIVEVYIRYLRAKLEAVVSTRIIHTVRSVGYILRDQ